MSRCVVIGSGLLSYLPPPRAPMQSSVSLRKLRDLSTWDKLDMSPERSERPPPVQPARGRGRPSSRITRPSPCSLVLLGFPLGSSSKATNQPALPESAWPNANVNFNANGQRNALDLRCVVERNGFHEPSGNQP